MKSLIKACLCIVLCLTLIACMQNETQKTATAAPPTAIVATSIISSARPTLSLLPSPDYAALPTFAFNTTPVIGTSAPYHTPDVDQFKFPYFQPTEIPGLLQSHLTIETLSDFHGVSVQRITGWRYGFKSLEWMDTNHLLLYPYAGIYSVGGGQQPGIFPAVASLDSNTFWIPLPSGRGGDYYPTLPRWSPRLGVLIAAASDTSVAIHSPDGRVRKVYNGKFLGVSPSATKLLIDDTWIDLGSGKTVNFAWQQTEMAANYSGAYSFRPIWSPDETRVYTCCYVYGDAKTGKSLAMPYYGLSFEGENEIYALEALRGTWVLNDKYVLPIWGGVWDGRYSAVYLFDPAAKTYRNLSALAGVPHEWDGADPYCNRPSAQNGGRYVWVDCLDGGHLIDLVTFSSQAYPPPFDGPYGGGNYTTLNTEWSTDGNFVWFNQEEVESILSGVSGELKPLPKNCSGFEWHPKDNVLLCMANNGKNILLLDVPTLSVLRQVTLPNKFSKKGWSPDGKHIALLASDNNSLWQIDYPNLDNLEQLTPAMPELTRPIPESNLVEHLIQNVVWSPDGSAIAFIGAQDIYIVQMDSRP